MHQNEKEFINSFVNVVPGRSAYYLDLYHSAHLLLAIQLLVHPTFLCTIPASETLPCEYNTLHCCKQIRHTSDIWSAAMYLETGEF